MAIDLDKISSELEDALEQARVLAEQRNHSQITPSHMLYVLLDKESSLAAMLLLFFGRPCPLWVPDFMTHGFFHGDGRSTSPFFNELQKCYCIECFVSEEW